MVLRKTHTHTSIFITTENGMPHRMVWCYHVANHFSHVFCRSFQFWSTPGPTPLAMFLVRCRLSCQRWMSQCPGRRQSIVFAPGKLIILSISEPSTKAEVWGVSSNHTLDISSIEWMRSPLYEVKKKHSMPKTGIGDSHFVELAGARQI